MSFSLHRATSQRTQLCVGLRSLVATFAACLLATALHAQTQSSEASGGSNRERDFTSKRSAHQGSPAATLQRAQTQHAAMLFAPRSATLTTPWQPLGPTAVVSPAFGKLTGRITAIALDPSDSSGNTVYLGTTGGGVWKSTNAAGPLASVSFAPLTDTLPVFSPNAGTAVIPSLSIGALALQPVANPVLLAGTGDPNSATDSLYGEGLLRSADGGLTWTLAQDSHDGANGNHSFVGLASAAIAWSTASSSRVVAAFTTSPRSLELGAANTASIPGLYYSNDAGQTWHMSTLYDGATVVQQPLPLDTTHTGNPVTSVVWNAARGRFYAAVRAHGYYSSPDGITWTRLANQPGTGLTTANCPVGLNGAGNASCPIYRGTLAVQPVTGDTYALTVDANNLDGGLWQDLCNLTSSGTCSNTAPVFATRLDNGVLEPTAGSTAIPQGGYTLALSAAPAANNGTLLFAGTTDLNRCTLASGATSCTWRNTTNTANGCATPAGVAPLQHALAAMPQSSGQPLLFLGNDGGLWRSTDGIAQSGAACNSTDSSHFDNLNAAIATGGSLAEIAGFTQHPTDADTFLASLGTNGTVATSSASSLAGWTQLSSASGASPLIDPATPTNWYAAIGAGVNLKLCPSGAACGAADFATPATIGLAQVANDNSLLDPPMLLDPAAPANLLLGTCRVWRGPAASGSAWSTANALSPSLNGGATPCAATSPLIRSLAAGGPASTSVDAQHNGSQVIYAGLAGLLDGGGQLAGHLFLTTSANLADGSSLSKYWRDISLNPVTNDTANAGVFNPSSFDVSSISIDTHDTTGATVYATIMGFGAPHLYRSADFGAHWLNISANLPDAPANSVVVDPNDANTVYVALDTGVYVTQTVTTCASTNCWSVLGTALPNAPVTQLAAAAQILTGDGRRGMLRAATYGRGLWQTPLLAAIGVTAPGLTVAPASLTFTAQQAATQSAAQTVTLTSTGSSPVTVSSLSLSGDFAETDTCSGQTLPVSGTCNVSLRFAPTASGTRTGMLTIFANIPGGQATVALSGIGTAPSAITLTPDSLTFAATVVNQTAAAQNVAVANTGSTAATLQTPVITGDFSISANTCPASLAAQTACSVSLTFTPTASGTRSGTFSISGSAGTQTAQLIGIGSAPATDTLTPTALAFTQQAVGSSSAAQQITLSNAGDVPLTLIAASITGSDFTVVNNCGASLAARSSCALSVTFVPTATGTRSASLTVSDQFRSQSVALSGIGVAPPGVSLSPTSLSFATTGVGLSAPAQTLTLTNNGGLALTISNTAVSGDFSLAGGTCGSSLAIGSSCTVLVVFTPAGAGTRSGTLVLTDNAPTGSQTVNLSGTGVDFTFAANGLTTATIASGGSATFPLLLNSSPALTGNVALSCSGAPAHSLCTVSPATPSLGASVPVSVVVQTGLSMASSHSPQRPWSKGTLLVLALAFPVVGVRAKRKRRFLLAGITFALVVCLSGCGAARLIPGSGGGSTQSTPTPSGTYNLTVTATAAGVSHNVALTLVVQ